jgi:hypothetical protein
MDLEEDVPNRVAETSQHEVIYAFRVDLREDRLAEVVDQLVEGDDGDFIALRGVSPLGVQAEDAWVDARPLVTLREGPQSRAAWPITHRHGHHGSGREALGEFTRQLRLRLDRDAPSASSEHLDVCSP